MHVYSKATTLNSVLLARAYEDAITNSSGNTYIGLGKVSEWTKPEVTDSVENLNTVFRNLISIKKITSSDVNLVIPDNFWVANTVYSQFDSDQEMYSHDSTSLLTGSIDYVSGSNNITGNLSSTFFTNELVVGDIIEFSGLSSNETKIRREIVYIGNNTNALINTSISASYSNSEFSKVTSVYPRYVKNFYVRNSYDQVFICLFNNGNSESSIEPILRPENFSIGKLIQDNSDGYVWRYLFTIPSGLKEKFYYTDNDGVRWIPVITDTLVSASAIDGAIENIRILDGGSGYNSNTPSSSADILSVSGDGTNASFFANVQSSAAIDSTTIVQTLTANSGSGYTYATITATGGTGANLTALISPTGGFGLDPAKDLGAKFLGLAVEFSSTESNTLPLSSTAGNVTFRQISVIRNPQYSNGNYITATAVGLTTNVATSYGSASAAVGHLFIQDSGFTGDIVGYNGVYPVYFILNNVKGTFSNTINSSFQTKQNSASSVNGVGTGLSIQSSPGIKRSGDILYVENVDTVTRDSNQYEQIKLVLKF